MSRPSPKRTSWLLLAGLFASFGRVGAFGLVGLAIGCAGGPIGPPVARDQVTHELCAQATRCDDIGAGGRSYPSVEACLGAQASAIETRWPPAACTGIETRALDDCLTSIRSTACSGGTALTELWLGVCAASNVCVSDASASP